MRVRVPSVTLLNSAHEVRLMFPTRERRIHDSDSLCTATRYTGRLVAASRPPLSHITRSQISRIMNTASEQAPTGHSGGAKTLDLCYMGASEAPLLTKAQSSRRKHSQRDPRSKRFFVPRARSTRAPTCRSFSRVRTHQRSEGGVFSEYPSGAPFHIR